MKKIFINALCYAALLGLVGCNHINNRMGMVQVESYEEDITIGLGRPCLVQDQTEEEERELEDKVQGVDINRYWNFFQNMLKQLDLEQTVVSELEPIKQALKDFEKQGKVVMELCKEKPMSQSEIAASSPPPTLEMPELYYSARIFAESDKSIQEESIEDKINDEFKQGKDLKMPMQKYKDNVDERIKSIEENAKAYPSIKEWVALEKLAVALGLVVEEIMGIVNEREGKLALESISLPEAVEALLKQIAGWSSLSNKVKVVLAAEAVVKQMVQMVTTIRCGKAYQMHEKELGESYIKKMNDVTLWTNSLFISVKKITLLAEKIWPELAGKLQKSRVVLDTTIKEQKGQLLEESLKEDVDTINQAIQARIKWLDKVEKALPLKKAE